MTKPWRNITTIWSDKKNCVFVFISVNLTGDSTFLPPSYPLFWGVAVFLTLCASRITNDVRTDRPIRNRSRATIFLKAGQSGNIPN